LVGLIVILSFPFALFAQTRKAIPAGRYEALSGIKLSRSGKNQDNIGSSKESTKSIWSELEKIYANDSGDILFANLAKVEVGIKSKNFKEALNSEKGFDLILTNDLKRDKAITKHLRGKKMIVLFDSRPLQKALPLLNEYEILNFQAEKASNLYLLKIK